MNALLSAIAVTQAEVERMRRELAVVEQRLATLRKAAGLPPLPSAPTAETPPAPPLAQAQTRTSDAAAWLRLALSSGPMPAREIRQRAATAGLAWRSMQRSAKVLRVVYVRRDFGPTTHTTWALPPEGGNA
jgi:hypothetical protein